VKAERDVGHSRTQRLAGNDGIVDCRRWRKDSGKERMQRAAIIGVVACARIRMRASVVTMTIGVMFVGVVAAGLVVTGMCNSGAGSRMGLLKRRRNNAGELRKDEQRDQCADKARYRPEPLHQCLRATMGTTKAAVSLRVSRSAVNPNTKEIPPFYRRIVGDLPQMQPM
jgi:hypothetical protein